MIIYLDENISDKYALSLNLFQEALNKRFGHNIQVKSTIEDFGRGATDEEILPVVGKAGDVLITKDKRIQRTRAQRELYHQHNVGVFFLKTPPKKPDLIMLYQLLVKHWESIIEHTLYTERPFAFRAHSRSSGLERV